MFKCGTLHIYGKVKTPYKTPRSVAALWAAVGGMINGSRPDTWDYSSMSRSSQESDMLADTSAFTFEVMFSDDYAIHLSSRNQEVYFWTKWGNRKQSVSRYDFGKGWTADHLHGLYFVMSLLIRHFYLQKINGWPFPELAELGLLENVIFK